MTLDTLTWKDNDKKMVCVWKYESLIRRSTFRPRKMSKFFRFLSRRRTGRGAKSDTTDHGGHPLKKKNAVQCTVMLLDGTDFTTEIHVSLANLDMNQCEMLCKKMTRTSNFLYSCKIRQLYIDLLLFSVLIGCF